MLLMLNPGRPASFRRTAKQDEGPAIVYTFEPREPLEVLDADLPALASDLGHAIVVPKEGTTKADFEATAQLAEMLLAEPKPKPRKRKSE